MGRRIFFSFLFILCFFPAALHSQRIVINEVMASNSRVLSDEYGAFEDWVALDVIIMVKTAIIGKKSIDQ